MYALTLPEVAESSLGHVGVGNDGSIATQNAIVTGDATGTPAPSNSRYHAFFTKQSKLRRSVGESSSLLNTTIAPSIDQATPSEKKKLLECSKVAQQHFGNSTKHRPDPP